MKKLLLTLATGSIFTISNAQAVLEHTYPNHSILQVFKIENDGEKYLGVDFNARKIFLYNDNHSVFKSIDVSSEVPASVSFFYPAWVSRNLFDNDNEIELYLYYSTPANPNVYVAKIINENGTSQQTIANGSSSMVYNINGRYKLNVALSIANVQTTAVYDLPGKYATSIKGPVDFTDSKLYPNPVSDASVLKYQLPIGVKEGVIKVSNMAGQEIKTYNITEAFDNILIYKSDLSPGAYTYSIFANGEVVSGSKFVVQ